MRSNPKGLILNCNGAFSAWTHEDTRGLAAEGGSGGGGSTDYQPPGGYYGGSNSGPLGQRVMDLWEQCALDKNCVTPPGTNRGNHRQDQAALT